MEKSVKRIVFTGDCLRTDTGEPAQLGNALWLQDVLGKQLHMITGLPIEAKLPSPGDCWRVLGDVPCFQSWARLFWQEADEALCEYLAPTFEDALVIVFELSPILESALNRLGVHWVEVGLSPLRFLPDIALSFRFSSELSIPNNRFLLSQREIDHSVARVREYYGATDITGKVYFAQSRWDRTLITTKGFVDVAAFLDTLDFPLWVKPHPGDKENPVIAEAVRRGGRILFENTYALLSSNIDVVTISSSVAEESRCFRKAPAVFYPDVLKRNANSLTTLDGYLCSDFWCDLLAGFPIRNVTFDLPFISNCHRLRLLSGSLDAEVYADHASTIPRETQGG